ncbi:MAG: TIGR04053 family radical SAM/SPASM domain-containing protein [Chloroflexi bacterium]|nr:TIGR04053 family radical SAM/SPASM domain-containing protein [Chloroflexota bacterium]
MLEADFDLAPFTIAWEVTRACAFACVHCRADAQHTRDPNELTTEEGFRLLDRFKEFGSPIVVFTGGDPMMRRDLFDLIRHATALGLRASLTPTATALPTVERLKEAMDAGVRRIALSLDAPSPEVHDAFRQVPGSWERTMAILRNAQAVGLSAQINTTVTRHNVHLLSEMVKFVEEVGAVQWSVFFLVPTGRGQIADMISPEEHERVFHWLFDLSQRGAFDIKATAAPMYRRVAIERRKALTPHPHPLPPLPMGEGGGVARSAGEGGEGFFQGAGFQYADGLNRPVKGVNDGRGFLFISHLGEIMPSGFLPVSAGNVRTADVVDVYRNHPMFKALRDPDQLKGKCRVCDYRVVCGGQRGRAFAITGDYLETDPACAYQPN